MVEFALVGPLFFVLLFGAVNCGLVLFSINAADQAANVGVQQLAALGDYLGTPPAGSNLPDPSNADDIALYEMQKVGLDSTGNTTVISYQVTKLDPSTLQTDVTSPCPCVHAYTVATQSWSGNWAPCGCGARNTTSTGADYIRLDVTYSYQWLFGAGPALQLTATRVIRLEPQS
jgi:hypothetical protein